MKRGLTLALALSVALLQNAEARIGENYRQCAARYGASYTNFPGFDHLLGVAVFKKDGINVTVAFDKPNRQGYLVLYTSGNYLTQRERQNAGDLKDNEIDALMKSLDVSWDSPVYEPPKASASTSSRIDPSMRTFAGPRKVKGGAPRTPPSAPTRTNSAPKPPNWTKNQDAAKAAVGKFVEAITLENPRYLPFGAEPQFTYDKLSVNSFILWPNGQVLESYRRSGDHLFAFKLAAGGSCFGLVLVNSDASKAISEWADAYVKSRNNPPPKEAGRRLEGF